MVLRWLFGSKSKQELAFVFWDVQHGSATYINTPNGTSIVQDLGTGSWGEDSQGFSPLRHLKDNWDVTRLDAVFITHPHKDHISDIFNFDLLDPRMLSRPAHLSKGPILEEARREDMKLFREYFDICERYIYDTSASQDPTRHENNGGVGITQFSPTRTSQSNLNNHSIVTVFEYAGIKVVLPGDNESASWNEVLETQRFRSAIRNADVLLAPHHGRLSGFHPPLFEHFNPRLTIISDGPYHETSATDRYQDVAKGWWVHRRADGLVHRSCVTTRQDGVIVVRIGMNGDEPYLEVTID